MVVKINHFVPSHDKRLGLPPTATRTRRAVTLRSVPFSGLVSKMVWSLVNVPSALTYLENDEEINGVERKNKPKSQR